jgi:hypothetical protein
MAMKYNAYRGDWEFIIDPEFYSGMNEEETNLLIDRIEEGDIVEDEFTPSNHILLISEYGIQVLKNDNSYTVDVINKTLVRGELNKGVTFMEILSKTRNITSEANTFSIRGYKFIGFSDNGYPTLDVDITF